MGQKLNPPIRVVFLTSGGLFPRIVFEQLIKIKSLDLVGIVRSTRVFGKKDGFLRGACKFFSKCGIYYTVYIWFVTTFAEWLAWISCRSGVEALAKNSRVPVFRTKDINTKSGISFLKELEPDVLICTHFDQKLYPPLCDGGLFSVVNLHPGRLPAYKGLEPVIQAILHGDKMVGITLHRVAEGIDEGNVIGFNELLIKQKESIFALTCRLMQVGASLLEIHLNQLGIPHSGRKQEQGGGYFGWPKPDAEKKLRHAGHWLIAPQDRKVFYRCASFTPAN